MTSQHYPEEAVINFAIMADGNPDMSFISRSVAGALEFYRVGKEQNTGATPEEITVGKGIINAALQAFALECAFKGLYQTLGTAFPKKHGLTLLYANLPKEARQEIEDKWKEWDFLVAPSQMTFEEFSQDHRDDFIEWRYLKGGRLQSSYHGFYAATMTVNGVTTVTRGDNQA